MSASPLPVEAPREAGPRSAAAARSTADRATSDLPLAVGTALAYFPLLAGALYALLATVGARALAPLALAVAFALAVAGSAGAGSAGWYGAPGAAGVDRRAVGLAAGAAVAVALLASLAFFDVYWDGLAYHQDGIVQVAERFSLLDPNLGGTYSRLTTSYPKLSWLYGAALYSTFGDVHLGKSLNGILLLAVLAVALSTLRPFETKTRLVFALALALNPIAASQLFSNLVDGALASFVTLATLGLLSFARSVHRDARSAAVFFAGVVGASALKFTGLVVALVAVGFLGVVLVGRAGGAAAARRSLRRASGRPVAVAGGALLAFLLLFNPYGLKALQGKHLFHPAMGAEKEDLIATQTTPQFYALDPWSKLLLSVFARSSNHGPWASEPLPAAKVPFTVQPGEIEAFGMIEVRAGGWGPLFGGVLLVAAVLVLSRLERLRGFHAVLAFLFVASVVNPESWWARLNPQLYVLVAVALLASSTLSAAHRVVALALGGVLLLNSFLVFRPMFAYVRSTNARLEGQLREIARSAPGGVVYWDLDNFHFDLVLDRLRIPHRSRSDYHGADPLQCTPVAVYEGFPESVCVPR